MNNEKSFASIDNPTIEAAANGFFRFSTKKQAVERLESIEEHFILSKNQPEETKKSSIMLWIRGFDLTSKEKKQGFMGNYAMLAVEKNDNAKYTIKAAKIESELKYHPRRKRTKQQHPNWGHPILRAVKKKRIYSTAEEARDELQLLHEEYPEISIPCANKMYIIIYSKPIDGGKPVKKYVLEIKVLEEGGFYIEAQENEYKAPMEYKKNDDKVGDKKDVSKEPKEQKGYFTSMVELRKKPPRK